MKNLQEATERICQLKGSLIAIDALLPALLEAQPPTRHAALARSFEAHAEAARTVMLNAAISDHVLVAFERDVARMRSILTGIGQSGQRADQHDSATAVLMTTTRITTFLGQSALSGASGFFFRRDGALFLATNRHVFSDEKGNHFPDRIEIEVHTDAQNLTRYAVFSIPLYRNGLSLWREAADSAGVVDVAVIELEEGRLPASSVFQAFDSTHLEARGEDPAIGDALAVIGFPLGFHDTVHHLAVARSASIASAYGIRFQQQGYFLTDARTHRGSSGSPVLRRRGDYSKDGSALSWQLLGVHSTRIDMLTRNLMEDESLGLNGAWYADVLMTLTEPRQPML
ncbi:serine protease [Corticibacter populi]|uniref:Serine protease n=1 Tax=Corticibacter populi TaxID=1550736 RepID=A0A3M6QPF7_9BURK|nr:serine protease [Corticibacter populi]RMX04950.1 serine protease [Corticibacter populi]RZS33624.1 trypsin-like peptidase [Corticibacter populi]